MASFAFRSSYKTCLTPPPKVPIVQQPSTPQNRAAASDQAEAADTGIVLPQQLLSHLQEVDTAPVQQVVNPQQQPQDQPPVDDVHDAGENEASLSDSEEMAEDKSVIPAPFSGKPGEDGDVWLRHFKNYWQYKEYQGPKSLALFKVLLIGNAAMWLDTLSQKTSADFDRFTRAFTERYEIPEVMKFKSAKEIFSRRQQVGESVDDYVAAIRRLARIIQVDDKVTQYAVLNGFLPNIAAHVVSQRPQSLDAILEAGRIAELTNSTKSASDQVLTEQLADVRSELKRLATQWDKFTGNRSSSSLQRHCYLQQLILTTARPRIAFCCSLLLPQSSKLPPVFQDSYAVTFQSVLALHG